MPSRESQTLSWTSLRKHEQTKSYVNLSNPKPGHITGGSGRSARRSGRAGSGKIGCQQNSSPRKQKSSVLSKASKKRRFNVSPEARTSEILCKPTEEQNQRLTRGLSPVHQRFIGGTRSALCSWLPTSGTTPCLCKPFSCKACPGTDGGTKSPVDPRFIRGLSAVYQRFITGASSALSSWLQTNGPTPICLCKPFSYKACPGKHFARRGGVPYARLETR